MTLIRKGQKVRLTPKRSANFTGELVGTMREDFNTGPGRLAHFELSDTLTTFNANAWDIEVINELPTEPGLYITANHENAFQTACIMALNEGGEWSFVTPEPDLGLDQITEWYHRLGLVRLVPEG